MSHDSRSRKNRLRQKIVICGIVLIVLVVGAVPAIRIIASSNEPASNASPIVDTAPTSTATEYKRVLFAGDSISVGRDSQLLSQSFREIVARDLKVNGSKSLTTVAKSGAKLKYIAERKGLPANLDLAIIELGTNDAGGRTPIKEFRSDYQTYLKRIRSHSPEVYFVCLGVWYGPQKKISIELDKVIEKSCEQNGGTFVPISDLYTNDQNHGPRGTTTWKGKSDLFHPNNSGHLAIATRVIGALHQ